jgi:hypothetical protein
MALVQEVLSHFEQRHAALREEFAQKGVQLVVGLAGEQDFVEVAQEVGASGEGLQPVLVLQLGEVHFCQLELRFLEVVLVSVQKLLETFVVLFL